MGAYETPRFVVPDEHLVPVNTYPASLSEIPPSRMFLIKKSLYAYKARLGADAAVFDASQGDGGAESARCPGRTAGSCA